MRNDRPSPVAPQPPPSLWDSIEPPIVVKPIDPPPGSIQDSFLRFHEANPWVYVALCRLARDLLERGQTKIGIGMLWEVLRWQHARATQDAKSTFKLNNNLRSRYVRLLMDQEKDLAGVFDVRALQAA